MKTVKRKAKLGERVKVVHPKLSLETLELGGIYTVTGTDDEKVVVTLKDENVWIFDDEYKVIIEDEPECYVEEKALQAMRDNPILTEAMAALITQTEKGISKYGKSVDPDDYPFSGWVDHAVQECIDMMVYLLTMKKQWNEQGPLIMTGQYVGPEGSVVLKYQEENARLREALEFYADQYTWHDENTGSPYQPVYESDASRDGGDKARRALEGHYDA